MGSSELISAQENRSSTEPNDPCTVEIHSSRQENSSYRSTGNPVGMDQRYEQGLAAYASQFQISREEVAPWFAEHVGERFGDEAILSAAGAWTDDELSLRDRSLIVIAALITQGGAEQQVRSHTRWAIQHGCTRQQLEALASLLGVYAGYPRASNGLMVMREELARLEQG